VVEKRSNKCATFFLIGRANFFTYLKEMLRSFVRTVGVVFASAGDGKIVTWNIPAANTRQTISVRRTTRPSSLPRRHVSAMSMIIGPESSGSAMARDSSIAILQMPLLPIARNSRASMRSRCRQRGPKYGFVPIQTDTFKLPGATRAAANSIAITPDGEACETTPSPSWYFGEVTRERLDLALSSTSSPARNARHRKLSHFGFSCQPGSRASSATSRASIGRVLSGTGSASSPFRFLAARGKIYAALALFNRLIAGPNGRSASQ
jgi:hypothetical protein